MQELINTNLATASEITAEKHREVETELLNLIRTAFPLAQGVYNIGDSPALDTIYTITFADIGTSDYYVIGSFKSLSSNYNDDNDIMWVWREPTSSSFKLAIREVAAVAQNVSFYWEIKAL